MEKKITEHPSSVYGREQEENCRNMVSGTEAVYDGWYNAWFVMVKINGVYQRAYGITKEDAAANAKVIAAAPDLLESLKKAVEWIEDLGGKDGAGEITKMKGAIKKAEQ